MKLPAELKLESLTVVSDTREQDGWMADDFAPMKFTIATLQSGDYSLAGLEHVVRVERKSLPDLVACVGREREIERLMGFPSKLLIVEADWDAIEAGQWRGKIKPQQVIGSLLGWQERGLPVLLAGDRQRAALFCKRFLFCCARRRWRELRTLASVGTEV